MQHISDDMDDLLRSAAENYPLKIGGADWESIADRLSSEEGDKDVAPVVVLPPSSGFKIYRYAALLLLLPLGYLIAKYAGWGDSRVSMHQTAPQARAVKEDSGKNNNGSLSASSNAAGIALRQNDNNNGIAAAQLTSGTMRKTVFGIKTSGSGIIDGNNSGSNSAGVQQQPADERNDKQTVVSNNRLLASSAGGGNLPGKPDTEQSDEFGSKTGDNTQGIPVPATKQPVAPVPPKGPVSHLAKIKRFYIGAYAAPEYSTVKYQPGSKIGFNYGGLFGYRLNKYLSIEAGIAAGKKYYTSAGKFFNTDVSWFRNLGTVISLSGYSTITEFPLNFKYSFKPGKEGNFFVAAGIISYVVHQENYIYVVDKNNSVYTVSNTPVMATTNFFSNLSISGGYESSLGGLCSFRVEPYYRVPVRGIGIGSLPITSMGLNIGITKKIK